MRGHALGAADEPQRPPRRSGARPAFPLAPFAEFTGVVRPPARGPRGGVPHPPNGPANRTTLPPTGIALEVGQIVNKGASVSVCSQDTLSRSSPRGAPRDARVAGTPLRGPSARPWIPAISAFTRVHSPSKTGVNALNDALCAGMSGVLLQHTDLRPWCVPANLRPSGELEPFVQRGVTAHRRGHQKAIALAEDALDIVGIDVGVADDHVVLLAGVDHPRHPLEHLGMLVLPGIAELLGEIALAD